jgi:inosine-uridine nucleoside N-ribohydrolase
MAMMVLLESPHVEVLGITIVTGNAWRDEEVQHTLRMLELIGRSDVPVAPGAVFPLVRTKEEIRIASELFGKVVWLGAWGLGPMTLAQEKQGVIGTTANPNAHGPWEVPHAGRRATHEAPG